MCRTGRARAACQRSIDSGKSEPQMRKLSIRAGCLRSAALKCPKSAESPVSLTPKKIFSPLGSRAPAEAPRRAEASAERGRTSDTARGRIFEVERFIPKAG